MRLPSKRRDSEDNIAGSEGAAQDRSWGRFPGAAQAGFSSAAAFALASGGGQRAPTAGEEPEGRAETGGGGKRPSGPGAGDELA